MCDTMWWTITRFPSTCLCPLRPTASTSHGTPRQRWDWACSQHTGHLITHVREILTFLLRSSFKGWLPAFIQRGEPHSPEPAMVQHLPSGGSAPCSLWSVKYSLLVILPLIFKAKSENPETVKEFLRVCNIYVFVCVCVCFLRSLQSGHLMFGQSRWRGIFNNAAESDHPCQQLHSAQLQEEENVL